MIKFIYIFILSFILFSCAENITKSDIEEINLDNEDIILNSINTGSIIDQTTDKEIDELIDILFDTSDY